MVEKRNRGTDMGQQWNNGTMMVEQKNRDDRPEEHRWWNSGTMMVEQKNSDSGTVKQIW